MNAGDTRERQMLTDKELWNLALAMVGKDNPDPQAMTAEFQRLLEDGCGAEGFDVLLAVVERVNRLMVDGGRPP